MSNASREIEFICTALLSTRYWCTGQMISNKVETQFDTITFLTLSAPSQLQRECAPFTPVTAQTYINTGSPCRVIVLKLSKESGLINLFIVA